MSTLTTEPIPDLRLRNLSNNTPVNILASDETPRASAANRHARPPLPRNGSSISSSIGTSPAATPQAAAGSSAKDGHSNNNNSVSTAADDTNNAPRTPRPGAAAGPPYRINPRDRDDAERVLPYCGAALMLPFIAANFYAACTATSGTATQYFVNIAVASVISGILAFVSSRLPGECMIIAMFVVGFLNESRGMGRDAHAATSIVLDGVVWLVVAAVAGVISSIFCKMKDVLDGRWRHRRERHVTERLYCFAPYFVGMIWSHLFTTDASLVANLFHIFSSITFCLALVGYGLLAAQVVRAYVPKNADMLSLVASLANASFGRVAFFGSVFSAVFFGLLAPTYRSIAKLLPHTTLCAVAIVLEVCLYDANW